MGFASSFQFQAELKAKLLTAISLQEFPLDFELFMLSAKHPKKRDHQVKETISNKPLRQLIKLIKERTGYCPYQKKALQTLEKPAESRLPVMPESPAQSAQQSFERQTWRHGQINASNDRPKNRPKERSKNRFTNRSEALTITIGTQNKTIQTVTAGLIIQRLGLLEHFLPRQGQYRNTTFQIRWKDFTSGAPIVEGLESNQLSIGILGDYPLLLSGVAKTRLVSFVASNPDGAGNTVIVPNRSSLTTLDDLRNRVIAVPFASAAHGMIIRTLSRAALLPEVTLASIDNLNIRRLTPRSLQADGYAYFAPLHDIASHEGQFRRLLESDVEQLPTFHGVVVRDVFADEHPELVIAYLKALIAAQHWYKTTPSALSLVSNWVGLKPEIVAKTLAYQHSDEMGLFFPETQIRTDWVEAHIQQLSAISGHEALGELSLDTWIQPELLDKARNSLVASS